MLTLATLDKSARETVLRIAAALGLLLPLSCIVCGRDGRFLCPTCEPELPALKEPYCSVCAATGAVGLCDWCASSRSGMDRVIAPYLMDGPVREMVHRLKYNNLRAAAPYVAKLMASHLESRSVAADLLAPVPLHPRRERSRGYNQAELLAKEIAKTTGLSFEPDVFVRRTDTTPQVELKDRHERRRNIVGAFECRTDLAGKSVLLVDDVVTTGGTASACAFALKARGASRVFVLALARQARGRKAHRIAESCHLRKALLTYYPSWI